MTGPLSATFSCHQHGGVVIVRIVGEIDVSDTHHLADTLRAAVMLAEHRVVVDVSGMSFVDIAATRAFDRARSRAFQDGVSVVLAAPSPSLAHLLSLTDPDGSLPVYDSVAEAIHPEHPKHRGSSYLKSVARAASSLVRLPST